VLHYSLAFLHGEDRKEMTVQHKPWNKEKAKRHAGWARIASSFYYAPFARRIAASLSTAENEPILVDLGCGSGILSVEVHRLLPYAKIIGVDPSRQMIEIAKGYASERERLNFEGRPGKAEEMPIQTNSVDLVFSQFSFHEWQDPAKGLSEVFRVLKRGASIVLRDFNRAWFSGWKRGLLKLLIAAIGESLEDHLEMFRFSFKEVASLLKEAGFDEIEGKGKGMVLFIRGTKR
jgi:ubiquinone/menaquinone biosynthesis C-methylase UbiE